MIDPRPASYNGIVGERKGRGILVEYGVCALIQWFEGQNDAKVEVRGRMGAVHQSSAKNGADLLPRAGRD